MVAASYSTPLHWPPTPSQLNRGAGGACGRAGACADWVLPAGQLAGRLPAQLVGEECPRVGDRIRALAAQHHKGGWDNLPLAAAGVTRDLAMAHHWLSGVLASEG